MCLFSATLSEPRWRVFQQIGQTSRPSDVRPDEGGGDMLADGLGPSEVETSSSVVMTFTMSLFIDDRLPAVLEVDLSFVGDALKNCADEQKPR
jgi:hypothetical protein